MLRRRLLAAIALAGVSLPARAQDSNECRGRGEYATARTEFASQIMVDQGGPAVEGIAQDALKLSWSNPGVTIDFSAETRVPSGRFEISFYSDPEIVVDSLTLMKDEQSLVTLSGAELEAYDSFDDAYFNKINLGDSKRTDRGQGVAVQTLLDGEPLRVVIVLDSGQRLGGRLQFRELGLRRAQAQQMARADLARYQAGECKLRIGSCYLTTAAVDVVGLPDDCWELRTLRAFRDGPLQRTVAGRALIADYYRFAPQLVTRISARTDGRRQWLRTYVTGIVPSAVAARLGLNRLALALYGRMTRRLQALAA